jgi:hypothetical protein
VTPPRRLRVPWGALGPSVAWLWPGLAWASSFRSLGIYLAALFAGIPCVALLLGLIVTTLVLNAKTPASPARGTYARVAIAVSAVLVPVFPVVALVFETGARGQEVLMVGLLSIPVVLLAAASILLAARLRRRNR